MLGALWVWTPVLWCVLPNQEGLCWQAACLLLWGECKIAREDSKWNYCGKIELSSEAMVWKSLGRVLFTLILEVGFEFVLIPLLSLPHLKTAP